MIDVLAVIGTKAIYFLYAWLIGCMLASTAANLKGYDERAGLATGMLLSILGGVIWMFLPARGASRWERVVRPTDLITIAGGFMLGASALLPWFESDDGNRESLLSGQFPLGVVVALAAAAAITHALLAASETGPEWVLTRGRTVALVLAVLALIVIVFRIASPPGGDSIEPWAYLGLAGAVLAMAGPALARLAPFPRASQVEHGPLPL